MRVASPFLVLPSLLLRLCGAYPALAQDEPRPADARPVAGAPSVAERALPEAPHDADAAAPLDALPEVAHVSTPEAPRDAGAGPPAVGAEEPAGGAPDRWADTYTDTSQGALAAGEDARGYERAPGLEPEDVALFVPRALLFVPKLILSAVLWPIVGLLGVVERYAIIPRIESALYWNDAHTSGWSPAVSFSSGVGFTYGVNVFHDDLFGHGESLSAAARYGGRFSQGYELLFTADRVGGSRVWMEARARYEINPHQIFEGIGLPPDQGGDPGTPADPRVGAIRSYYRQERFLGLLGMGYTNGTTGSILKVGFTGIFNVRDFGANDTGDTQTGRVYDSARIAGFDDRVTTLELQVSMVVDKMVPSGLNATGISLELFGGYVPAIDRWTYGHYGGELRWTIDLFGGTRLLSLRTALEAVEGNSNEIPFTDLSRLGGADRLRGYREDEFRDRRAAMASAEYRYPIHKNIQGELFIDTGFVAPSYSDLFGNLGDWKVGGGGGLLFGSEDSVDFRLELAYGDGLRLFFSTDIARAFDARSTEL